MTKTYYTDYTYGDITEQQAARIAALEAENAALKQRAAEWEQLAREGKDPETYAELEAENARLREALQATLKYIEDAPIMGNKAKDLSEKARATLGVKA